MLELKVIKDKESKTALGLDGTIAPLTPGLAGTREVNWFISFHVSLARPVIPTC
jgi:hypothetical protein